MNNYVSLNQYLGNIKYDSLLMRLSKQQYEVNKIKRLSMTANWFKQEEITYLVNGYYYFYNTNTHEVGITHSSQSIPSHFYLKYANIALPEKPILHKSFAIYKPKLWDRVNIKTNKDTYLNVVYIGHSPLENFIYFRDDTHSETIKEVGSGAQWWPAE